MKKPNYLKGLRVVLAILIFVPILLFFVDFADVLPDNLHTLLHLQIMPAILGGMAGLVVFQFVLLYCSAGSIARLFARRAYCKILSTGFSVSGRRKRKEYAGSAIISP